MDKKTDAAGWTEVAGIYRAPSKATKATIELHLRWAPGGRQVHAILLATEEPETAALATIAPSAIRHTTFSCSPHRMFQAEVITRGTASQRNDGGRARSAKITEFVADSV